MKVLIEVHRSVEDIEPALYALERLDTSAWSHVIVFRSKPASRAIMAWAEDRGLTTENATMTRRQFNEHHNRLTSRLILKERAVDHVVAIMAKTEKRFDNRCWKTVRRRAARVLRAAKAAKIDATEILVDTMDNIQRKTLKQHAQRAAERQPQTRAEWQALEAEKMALAKQTHAERIQKQRDEIKRQKAEKKALEHFHSFVAKLEAEGE